jgi:hypothetical protein
MKALDVLINLINSQLKELNESNFKIYDADNRDYFISTIEYSKEDYRLIFNCKEEK